MASAISEALITTAAGLIVAIPCLFFFVFFKNKLNAMVADVQRTAEEGLSAAIATVNADQQLAKVPEGIAEG
ncbi:MAG: MotA/TolQ/ExbB proton channel family protein [Verrucomicrobiales bacterium]